MKIAKCFKERLILIPFVLFFMIISFSPVFGKELAAQQNVPLNKEWKLKFSQALDPTTLKSNITLTDANGILFSIQPIIDPSDSKSVVVKHYLPFTKSTNYKLLINPGIKSISSNKSLAEPVSLPFSTVSDVPTVATITQVMLTINLGQTYALPSTVEAIMSDGSKKQVAVVWDGSTISTSKVGTYTAYGSIVGSNIKAVASVTVKDNPIYTSSQIFDQVSPSVVYIEVYNSANKFLGSGSGFVIDANGKIATNYHVIKGAYSAKVKTKDGKIYDVTKVYSYDDTQDMALIKVNTSSLIPAILGNSDKINTGDKIYTIGNPYGFEHTISDGLVSTKSRIYDDQTYIQISAPISPGSSGGVIVNEKSEVMGITTWLFNDTASQNLNFCIPINKLKSLLTQDINKTLGQLLSVSAPQNLVATAVSSSEIRVQWDQVNGADHYYLYVSSDGISFKPNVNSDGSKMKFPWASGYSAYNDNLDPNTKIYYKVTAVKNGVESVFSNLGNATTFAISKPSAPSNLLVTAVSSNEVRVQWDQVSGAEHYYLYGSFDGIIFVPSVSSDGSKKQFKWASGYSVYNDNLDPNTKIYYKVTAVKNGVESNFSNEANATTFAISKPSAPSNLIANAISSSEMTLQWSEVSGVEYYYVYISNDGGLTYLIATNDDGTKKQVQWESGYSIKFFNSKANTKYYFKVKAIKNGVESDYSNIAYATTFSNIIIPTTPITPDFFESYVDGSFSGWSGDTIFKLMNGQIWQQSLYGYWYHYAYMPKVIIYKSGLGFKMKLDGYDNTVSVTRLK